MNIKNHQIDNKMHPLIYGLAGIGCGAIIYLSEFILGILSKLFVVAGIGGLIYGLVKLIQKEKPNEITV